MSTISNPSPPNGDTENEGTAREPITDVAVLEEGDRILVGDRTRPLVVRESRSRQVDARGGWVDQHEVDASGEWADARTLTLTTQIARATGEPTEKICVDRGRPHPVWRIR